MRDPTLLAKNHSIKVCKYIKEKIKIKGGSISFAEFMQSALYAPNLGYYYAGCQKFGKSGDFITAPMMGSLFASCVFNQCVKLIHSMSISSSILELGAGDGQLASKLIELLINNSLFTNYFILEPSYELRQRQKKLLLNKLQDNHKNKIVWLDELPKNFNGIILANEVLDALPVELFTIKDHCIFEKRVQMLNNQFFFIEVPASEELTNHIATLPLDINNYKDNIYSSEVCLLISGLIKSLSSTMQQGAVLLFDYGFLAQEYYHPDRSLGTLMCHYQHCVHTDPFFFPGLQDITSHVNFSLVMQNAIKNNLEVLDFCSMANFLINNNLQVEIDKSTFNNISENIKLSQELHTLISPQEMGEIFKVLLLIKK